MKKVIWVSLCLYCAGLAPLASAATSDVDARREAWVVMAREGELDRAINGLSELYEATADAKVRDDLIALRLRAGRDQAALDTCTNCSLDDYSAVSLEALGGAARRQSDLPQALAFYQTLLLRDPDQSQGWLGLALTSIDQGFYSSASMALSRYEERFGRTDDWLEARAYMAARSDDSLSEIQNRQLLVEQQPRNEAEVQALYRLSLTLGATRAASRLLERYPDAFTGTDRLWLDYYAAAADLRLAKNTSEIHRAEAGLANLSRIIATDGADPSLVRRAEYDKVAALVLLRRFEEAEALSTDLASRHGQLPAYVKKARADALLGLGRPEAAAVIYQDLVLTHPDMAKDPEDPLFESLVYAYSDAQNFTRAERVLDGWARQEEPTRWNFTGTQRIPNPNYDRVQQLDVLLTAWRGDLESAMEQVDALIDRAPGNASLWRLRGDIASWRGWPREAEANYQRALGLSSPSEGLFARYGILSARLERSQWRDTVVTIKAHQAEDPPSVGLEGLTRDYRELRAGGVIVDAEQSDAQGSGLQSSRDWAYKTRLEAPRNAAGSRFFAERIGLYGEYEGDGLYAAYTNAGYEFNLYPATLSLAIGEGAQLNENVLAWGQFDYAFNDQWAAGMRIAINAAETPLRALRDDIYADLYQLEARYRRDEAGEGSLSLGLMDLEDGNLRQALSAGWRETLYDYDAWQLDGSLSLAGSRNDDIEASYFNPRKDASGNAQLTVSHQTPLGYRQAFLQSLQIGAGSYWQDTFGSDATWLIGYGHEWLFAPVLRFRYGVIRMKNVYDGSPEYTNRVTAGLEWRFL